MPQLPSGQHIAIDVIPRRSQGGVKRTALAKALCIPVNDVIDMYV